MSTSEHCSPKFEISDHKIGADHPTFIIAEMSANHNQNLDHAIKLIEAAKAAGADAIKIQTYTADTITIDSDQEYFQVGKGSLWEGKTLYKLYQEAHTPWEWHAKLQEVSTKLGMIFFSTPFDPTAVDYLENLHVPVHKIASFEVVDIPLIRKVARTGKPIIMSTGMATEDEITEAVDTIKKEGNSQIALLKCTSAYPAQPEEMNLLTIPALAKKYGVVTGLSDHTLGIEASIAAVALGASIIEKHFTLSRGEAGPDSAFSLEPAEFKSMVQAARATEKALGHVYYGYSAKEGANRIFRKSLFICADMKAGDIFNETNLRSIRPAHGLHSRHLSEVLGRRAKQDTKKGTPLRWDLVD